MCPFLLDFTEKRPLVASSLLVGGGRGYFRQFAVQQGQLVIVLVGRLIIGCLETEESLS